jgi:hypothetical protein
MNWTISREEIITGLAGRGFVRSDVKAHAEHWVSPEGDSINLKTGDRFPLVIHPRHDDRLSDFIAIPGIMRGPGRYAHNSNFVGFPERLHTGEKPVAFGIDFGFDSAAALERFLDVLAGMEDAGHVQVAVFDDEAMAFLDGFLDAGNPQFVYWLPRYIETLRIVHDALQRNDPDATFDRIWKSIDNAVSNAGQGVLGFDAADRMRKPLVEVIREISQDDSASQFDRLVARLEQWRQEGKLPKLPRLLLARAFAAIHPDRYHTTVDAEKQARIIPWFERHTGFVAPEGNWAAKAGALTVHLERCGVFGGDRERRNMFPWYVFDQLRDATGKVPFRPGHTSRPATGEAESRAQRHTIEYRQNVIQDCLVGLLRDKYGHAAVATEHPTGTGGRADALVQHDDGSRELYEIKPASSAREAVRQALGQLLEYAYRRDGLQPAALHVVSDAPMDDVTLEYLQTLETRFDLKLGYMQVAGRSDKEAGHE